MKLIRFIVEVVFWIQIAITPILVFGLSIFIFFTFKRVDNLQGWWIYILPILIIGLSIGVYFAERIRRTVGCANFMGRVLGMPEIHHKRSE